MTNNTVTIIISSKYLQINEIYNIRERFIIRLVFTIFVGIQLKKSPQRLELEIRVPLVKSPQLSSLNPESTAWNPKSKTVSITLQKMKY